MQAKEGGCVWRILFNERTRALDILKPFYPPAMFRTIHAIMVSRVVCIVVSCSRPIHVCCIRTLCCRLMCAGHTHKHEVEQNAFLMCNNFSAFLPGTFERKSHKARLNSIKLYFSVRTSELNWTPGMGLEWAIDDNTALWWRGRRRQRRHAWWCWRLIKLVRVASLICRVTCRLLSKCPTFRRMLNVCQFIYLPRRWRWWFGDTLEKENDRANVCEVSP